MRFYSIARFNIILQKIRLTLFIMKKKIDKIFLLVANLILLMFLLHSDIKAQQTENRKIEIKPFSATIVNSYYAEAYSVLIVLTNKQLKIIYKSDIVGTKDTVIFSKALQSSDTLKMISEIKIDQLKEYYTNPCIDDGSQVMVTIKKQNRSKSVQLSNYYQEDIGRIIYLINSLIPAKYKVWYDKEILIADYKRCKTEKNAAKLDSLNN